MNDQQLNLRISQDLRDRLVEYSMESGVPQSVLIRRALDQFLPRYRKRRPKKKVVS